MNFSITLAALAANDNNRACDACGERRADVRDGYCARCNADICNAIDAHGRYHVGDDEGAALTAGFDVGDSLRFID